MDIVEVDPQDDGAVAAWHATYLASETFQRPHATPWMLPEVVAELRGQSPGERRTNYSGLVDGEVVVAASAELPLLDNTSQAWIAVDVHPAHRCRGFGSAMLEHLVAVAADAGRPVLVAEASYPFEGPADGTGHPAVEFLRSRGFTMALGDVQRVLDLPVDPDLLDLLVADAAAHHEGYAIRQFVGPVPEELIVSFGELVGRLVVEAPQGELRMEPEVYTPERIRAEEKVAAAAGRTVYSTVALTSDGSVVAYSDLVVPSHDPGRAYQWGTLVAPEHRGHRLGLAVKAHNLRQLQQHSPDVRILGTFNAELNRHMIGVNEQLGFRPVERLAQFQRKLA